MLGNLSPFSILGSFGSWITCISYGSASFTFASRGTPPSASATPSKSSASSTESSTLAEAVWLLVGSALLIFFNFNPFLI